MKPRPAHMLIEHCRRDGGTQIRGALDEATVSRYAEALKAGAKFPDVRVFYDGKDHWLSNGFHRVEAHLRVGRDRIMAEIVQGTRRDAILDACGANAEHGLPRSNADKRRAVETILADAEWSTLPDKTVARLAKVSNHLVAEVRESMRMTRDVNGNSPVSTSVSHTRNNSQSNGETMVQLHLAGEGSSAAVHVSKDAPTIQADAGMASGSGDEGAGVKSRADEAGAESDSSVTPAPDEPCMPALDLLGLDDIDPAWLALVADVEEALGAFDQHLRQAQGDLAPLLGGAISNDVQALRMEAHGIAARARKSVLPESVCKYCKDPDGSAGRRVECSGCHNLGWLTADQLSAVPRELEAKGEAAKVIDQKAGGYVPRARALKVGLVDEAGNSTPFEDDDGGPGW